MTSRLFGAASGMTCPACKGWTSRVNVDLLPKQSGHFDLVLLDVQMPDGTGFDVIREVGPQQMPAVVFVTAYDKYAIQAFEVNAVDYLLKPFDDLRLRESIDRARE